MLLHGRPAWLVKFPRVGQFDMTALPDGSRTFPTGCDKFLRRVWTPPSFQTVIITVRIAPAGRHEIQWPACESVDSSPASKRRQTTFPSSFYTCFQRFVSVQPPLFTSGLNHEKSKAVYSFGPACLLLLPSMCASPLFSTICRRAPRKSPPSTSLPQIFLPPWDYFSSTTVP